MLGCSGPAHPLGRLLRSKVKLNALLSLGRERHEAPTRWDGRIMHSHRDARSLEVLTAKQLAQYRRELEQSLRGLAQDAPVRDLVQRKLTAVVAEQETRIKA